MAKIATASAANGMSKRSMETSTEKNTMDMSGRIPAIEEAIFASRERKRAAAAFARLRSRLVFFRNDGHTPGISPSLGRNHAGFIQHLPQGLPDRGGFWLVRIAFGPG